MPAKKKVATPEAAQQVVSNDEKQEGTVATMPLPTMEAEVKAPKATRTPRAPKAPKAEKPQTFTEGYQEFQPTMLPFEQVKWDTEVFPNHRKSYDKEFVISLAESIAQRGMENNLGIWQREFDGKAVSILRAGFQRFLAWLLLRSEYDTFCIHSGISLTDEDKARIIKAQGMAHARNANLSLVAVKPARGTYRDMVLLGLIENMKRRDPAAIDYANAIQELQKEGMGVMEIAAALSVSHSTISQYNTAIQLLPEEGKEALEKGELTLGDAKVVAQEVKAAKKAGKSETEVKQTAKKVTEKVVKERKELTAAGRTRRDRKPAEPKVEKPEQVVAGPGKSAKLGDIQVKPPKDDAELARNGGGEPPSSKDKAMNLEGAVRIGNGNSLALKPLSLEEQEALNDWLEEGVKKKVFDREACRKAYQILAAYTVVGGKKK